jgi:hypothetical protein
VKAAAFLSLGLAACSVDDTAISSMNYLIEPMDPACAVETLSAIKGYVLEARRGDRRRTVARFDIGPVEDLTLIVSNPPRGASEASVFVRPPEDATSLQRRMARMAVREADEAIYVNCTEDGRSKEEPAVVIESQKE